MSELEIPEPIPGNNRKEEENTNDFDDKNSIRSEVSAHGSHNSDEEPHSSDIKSWDTANEHSFCV